MVFGAIHIAKDGNIVRNISYPEIKDTEIAAFMILFTNPIPHPSVVIKRSTMQERYIFNEAGLDDHNLYLDLLHDRSLGPLPVIHYQEKPTTIFNKMEPRRDVRILKQ